VLFVLHRSSANLEGFARSFASAIGISTAGPETLSLPRVGAGIIASFFEAKASPKGLSSSCLKAVPSAQVFQDLLNNLLGRHLICHDEQAAVLAGVLQAAALLLVVLREPAKAFAFGARLEAGIQKDEDPGGPSISPKIRDAGVLLGNLGSPQVLCLEELGNRGLAGTARANQSDQQEIGT
jgi:hypothetical protein